jgi:hypothetical protein
MVHLQDHYCDATDRGQPDEFDVVPVEVIVPAVFARVEEVYDGSADGIKTGHIRTLVAVAKRTRQREVI